MHVKWFGGSKIFKNAKKLKFTTQVGNHKILPKKLKNIVDQILLMMSAIFCQNLPKMVKLGVSFKILYLIIKKWYHSGWYGMSFLWHLKSINASNKSKGVFSKNYALSRKLSSLWYHLLIIGYKILKFTPNLAFLANFGKKLVISS